MTNPQYSILTVAGKNAEAAAMANATPITIAEVALGDGDRFPTGAEIALENEVHRGPLTASGVVDGNANIAFFDLYIPVETGGFVIREAGLFDDVGTMIAIARFDPAIPKFDPATGATNDLTIRVHVVFSDLENVVFSIEPLQAVTINNIVQAIPWATNAEAIDPLIEYKAIDPKRLALALAAALNWASDVEALDEDAETLSIDPKRMHLAINAVAFPGPGDPPREPSLPQFLATCDRSQVLAYATEVALRWDVIVASNLPNATFDGTTITIGAGGDGLYLPFASGFCSPQPSGGLSLYMYVNGSLVLTTGVGGVASAFLSEMIAMPVRLAEGDTIHFTAKVAWTGGAPGSSTFDPVSSHMSMIKLSK